MSTALYLQLFSQAILQGSSAPPRNGGGIPELMRYLPTGNYLYPGGKAYSVDRAKPRKVPRAAEALSGHRDQPLISESCIMRLWAKPPKSSQPWECKMP